MKEYMGTLAMVAIENQMKVEFEEIAIGILTTAERGGIRVQHAQPWRNCTPTAGFRVGYSLDHELPQHEARTDLPG